MDSDSESAKETQIQELQQLTAVIRADDAALGESSRCFNYSTNLGSTSSETRDSISKNSDSESDEETQIQEPQQLTAVIRADDAALISKNSDSESDEETQIQELQQLTAVIRADDAALGESSRCSTYSTNLGSTSSETRDSISKIESALALNKLLEEKYVRLESIMLDRLHECQIRLAQFKEPLKLDGPTKFRYFHCGRPYFRDRENFPPPDNEDTILMNQLGIYDLSMISSGPAWTVKDKIQFLDVLLNMSRAAKTKELEFRMAQLIRDAKISKPENLGKSLSDLKKEIELIERKSLDEVALEIDQDYDWDLIENQLNRRHSANEYKTMWKLFLHPSINKSPWSKAEHATLQQIAALSNFQNWDKIAKELGTGRTGYQCFVYFRTNTSNTVTGQKWTQEEEENLKRLIEFYREDNYIPWNKIAAAMENRTKTQLYNKYSSFLVKRKGRFLAEEDSVILACVKKFGTNFTRVAQYLPGRSAKQLQVRYGILSSKHLTSVVWTPEEDKKLVQIVANADTVVNYASITKFFPGKNRSNIRARYVILERWMKQHPFEDIAKAPRRAARRLAHGKTVTDIDKAMKSLKIRMQKGVGKKKYKVTIKSAVIEIEDSIVATLTNEAINEAKKKNEIEDEEPTEERPAPPTLNENNLHRTLLMLKAKLDKHTFEKSKLREKYPGLTKCTLPIRSVRSYSKAVPVEPLIVPDIWGENPLLCTQYHLPPNYDTITGCRKLMNHVSDMISKLEISRPSFALLEKRNVLIREQKRLLMVRFTTLFLWPMMLSCVSPRKPPSPESNSSKIPTQTITYGFSQQWAKPPVREKHEVNEKIDLEAPAPRNVTDICAHVENDDFMYLPADQKFDENEETDFD